MAFQCVKCHAEIDRTFKACPHCGEPVTDFLRQYADHPVDGKYRIIERLGAGGMGEVYKVEHVFLKAIRVIKVIRPQISESEDAHDRFLREAQLATKVHHPAVATLHDFSALPDGSHYMVWEFIDGENLAQLIRRRGVLAPGYAIRLAVQALNGLEAIHRAGIVHRDISPENLMITRDDQLKIIDLGVAKGEEGDYAATRTGIFVGKLRYSSPEQLGFLPEGEKIDGRADLYSMAIVTYEMLTGRPPFEATSPHQYILHHSRETQVLNLDLARLPGGAELQEVLSRALDRDRTKRFASAKEFAEALDKVSLKVPTQEDDTLRLTPPPQRAATTVRTDFKQAPPAAPTIVAKPPRRQTGLFLTIIVLVFAFGAFATWHFMSRPQAVVTNTIAAPPAPREPESVASTETTPTFTENGPSSRNDEAMTFARARLSGVTRVSLDARGDADLIKELHDSLSKMNLTVTDGADVTIRFYGKVTHLRFGRKQRAAEASILKRGQTIFHYEMKPEEYRVGDNPAEAFARVLSDVFGH